jgi:hypothetical protein
MRYLILAAGAALALAACSNGNDAQNNGTDLEVGNLIVNDTGDMNAMAPVDMNATTTNTDMNATANDLTTNDADTNLANGT